MRDGGRSSAIALQEEVAGRAAGVTPDVPIDADDLYAVAPAAFGDPGDGQVPITTDSPRSSQPTLDNLVRGWAARWCRCATRARAAGAPVAAHDPSSVVGRATRTPPAHSQERGSCRDIRETGLPATRQAKRGSMYQTDSLKLRAQDLLNLVDPVQQHECSFVSRSTVCLKRCVNRAWVI